MFCVLLFDIANYVFLLFMYSYHVCSILRILFRCVVLCIVCVYMCTVLLPTGISPIAVNRYINLTLYVRYLCCIY